MGLKRTWICDRCGKTKDANSIQDGLDDHPPSGWQVIPFTPAASVVYVLLCDGCMATLYTEFIQKKE